MKILSVNLLGLLIMLLAVSACRRPDNSIVINATPFHHDDRPLQDCMVRYKFNTSDMPGSYEDSMACVIVNGKPVAVFKGMKKGNYYFYASAYDAGVPGYIEGGVPFTVKDYGTHELRIPIGTGEH